MADLARKQGFSLVELVIVVVIVGIIAAIAVPRLSRASKGASEATLLGSLRTMRDAIDMYATDHAGTWPAQDKQLQTLIDQLTKRTNAAGAAGTTAGEHVYGPYLRSSRPFP